MQKFAQYSTSTWEIMRGNHTIYSIDFNTKESIEFTSGKIKITINFEVMPFDMINKIAKINCDTDSISLCRYRNVRTDSDDYVLKEYYSCNEYVLCENSCNCDISNYTLTFVCDSVKVSDPQEHCHKNEPHATGHYIIQKNDGISAQNLDYKFKSKEAAEFYLHEILDGQCCDIDNYIVVEE